MPQPTASSAPGRTRQGSRLIRTVLALLTSLLLLSIGSRLHAQAISFAEQTTVGAQSSPMSVPVAIRSSGSLSTVKVLTQGVPNLDYVASGPSTCNVGTSYSAGQTCTVSVMFSPTLVGLRTGAVVLSASDGTILGQAFVSGIGAGGIATFIPGEMSTYAGHALWFYAGDGGLAVNASIYLPSGIAVDGVGNVYIADSGNNRVRKVTAATGTISTVAGNGAAGDTGDGGRATSAALNAPISLAIDGAGDLYISDSANGCVRKVVLSTGIISTIVPNGTAAVGSTNPPLALTSPGGVAVDNAGNLYVADTVAHAVFRVDAVTGVMTTVAGTGRAGYNGDNITATAAMLNAPWGVSFDVLGNMYLGDQGNNRIRQISPSGIITTLAGTGTNGFSGDSGPATSAVLDEPAYAVTDAAGNLYIADAGNNRVRRVNASNGIITTIAGTAYQSISGDGGPANVAGLYGPSTLALDGTGDLYIADVFHNRIRKITSNKSVLDYTPIRVNSEATAQFETVENDGNASLTVNSVTAGSNAVLDALTTTCFNNTVLTWMESCVIGASFAPTVVGTPVLGSVTLASNAFNNPGTLTVSGNSLSQDSSTASITSSANPARLGDTVTFTVTVSTPNVVATGQVTLNDGGAPIASANLDANGVAIFPLSTLTGGQHLISAAYAGDVNNTASATSSITEIVEYSGVTTQTVLSSSTAAPLAGVPMTLTAKVTTSSSNSGAGTITGPVTFFDGTTIIGSGTVANNVVTVSIPGLSVGQHSLVATYSGSSVFGASSSSAVILNVQAGTTATALSTSANPLSAGAQLTLLAAVTSNGAAPNGPVTFLSGTSTLGSVPVDAMGRATLQLPGGALPVGTYALTARYGGDPSNAASASSLISENVVLATTSTLLTTSQATVPQGTSLVFTATVTGNGGVPTGSVQLMDGTTSLGSAKLGTTDIVTFTITSLGIGTHPITAIYSGDAQDKSSSSAPVTELVNAATTTVTLTPSANPGVGGNPLTFAGLVQGTGAQPTGTLSLLDGTTQIGSAAISGTGSASFTNVSLGIGVHQLTAAYSGDADHAPNTGTLTETVVQTTSTTLTSSAPSALEGLTTTFTVSVVGAQGQSLSGKVQILDGGKPLTSLTLTAGGTATFSASQLAVGTHLLVAAYSGDTLDQPSQSTPLSQVVQLAPTSATLMTSANPSIAGSVLSLTASVSGKGVLPTGLVTFYDGTSQIGQIRVGADSTATLSLRTLAPGLHQLTASYPGDPNNAPSVSAALSEIINQQTVLTLYSSQNPSLLRDSVTITVAAAGGLSQYPPSGNITLTGPTGTIATVAMGSGSTAHFTLNAPALGSNVLTATYAGDSKNNPAVSAPFTQNVTLRPTPLTLVTSATSISAGGSVSLLAVAQASENYFPTGSITFVSGATTLGSVPLDATGVAILQVTPPPGTYSIVAQYSSDGLFASSSSAPAALTMSPATTYAMSVNPATVSLASGAHTTIELSMTAASSFNDTLALGCAGLPQSVTCTFSQGNVKMTGGAATASLILDTGTPLGAGPSVSMRSTATDVLACGIPGGALLGLLCFRRSRFRKALSLLALLLCLGATGMLSGCGSSLDVTKTPAGQYTIQIIGKGVNSGVVESGSLALTVTQ